jgi:hypothetical protein
MKSSGIVIPLPDDVDPNADGDDNEAGADGKDAA